MVKCLKNIWKLSETIAKLVFLYSKGVVFEVVVGTDVVDGVWVVVEVVEGGDGFVVEVVTL